MQGPIGIIGAMENEVESLVAELAGATETTSGGVRYFEGSLVGRPVVLARSGVGKVNAALCAHVLAADFGVAAVVNTGVAGAIDAGLSIGDVVVANEFVYNDVDVTNFGYALGEVPQMGIKTFPADAALSDTALAAARVAAPDARAVPGLMASGDSFVRTVQAKQRIAQDFGAACCDMEATAIAHACYLDGVPVCAIRCMSDTADGGQPERYDDFEELMAKRSARIVLEMLASL